MKDKFNHIERRGLPGGPNEQFTYVTGVFSTDGYRYDSPDVNNIYNVIPSGNISMREKNGEPLKKGPILGIDNLGNRELMQPGFDYQFPGDQVFELPMAQIGKETKKNTSIWLNPKNWGVSDYTNKGDFNKAFELARKVGEKEFMYKNKRYNTKYAGTPRQEVGKYGVDGKPVDIDNSIRLYKYPSMSMKYMGHIAAENDGNVVDYGPSGNFKSSTQDVEKNYNVYNANKELFNKVSKNLPIKLDPFKEEKNPNRWTLATNNCADNVCDAFGIPRSKGIQTPSGALSKIKEKYPTIDVTGRTYEDYYNMSKSLLNKKSDDVLNQSKNLIGIISSPDLQKSGVSKNITIALQKSLSEKGYKLPKSTKQDGSFDGIYGDETKNALQNYQIANSLLVKQYQNANTKIPNKLPHKENYAEQGMQELLDLDKKALGGLLMAQKGTYVPPNFSDKAQRGGNVLDKRIISEAERTAETIDSWEKSTGKFLEDRTVDLIDYAKKNPQLKNYVEPAMNYSKDWLFENIRPVAYPTVLSSIKEVFSGISGKNAKPSKDTAGDYNIGEEAWRMALGLNTKPKYFEKSQYKPEISTDKNATYYKLSDDVIDKQKLIDEIDIHDMKIGDKKYIQSLAPYINKDFMQYDEFSQIDPLQKFKISIGKDKKGAYLSIYDKYDFENTPLNSFTKPFEIYDRIYLDKEIASRQLPKDYLNIFDSYNQVKSKQTNSFIKPINKKHGGDINQPKYQTGNEIAFDIYKKYINGDYIGTLEEDKAKKTYDRLNRIYYKDAKSSGMSVPNYIMTNVVTL